MKLLISLLVLCCSSFAMAEVVVIGNPNAPQLTKKEAQKLFLGKIKKLPGIGRVQLLSLEEGPTRDYFNVKLLRKREAQLKAYWAKLLFTGKADPPKTVGNSEVMLATVANSPNTIGYIDSKDLNDSVKVLYTLK
ncbi:type 2 periplasmic-binding domain-containing protein [Dongshaea marina]|uniref:phosphate ABC transporter substrate-binding protein n=1 Tax=Dongshaea marina TaxID=2047966 RepID=UPI000D3E39B3|nr:phosphate ABC transporter substrate-binding protein [Dongshaea marina]